MISSPILFFIKDIQKANYLVWFLLKLEFCQDRGYCLLVTLREEIFGDLGKKRENLVKLNIRKIKLKS